LPAASAALFQLSRDRTIDVPAKLSLFRDTNPLRIRIAWQTRAIAEREVIEQQARNTRVFDDVAGTAHDHRGNTGSFEDPRGEAHGLVTVYSPPKSTSRRKNAAASGDLSRLRAYSWPE